MTTLMNINVRCRWGTASTSRLPPFTCLSMPSSGYLCTFARVVRAAALALCSLTLKNQANKTRCASQGAVPILLDIVRTWGIADDGE